MGYWELVLPSFGFAQATKLQLAERSRNQLSIKIKSTILDSTLLFEIVLFL